MVYLRPTKTALVLHQFFNCLRTKIRIAKPPQTNERRPSVEVYYILSKLINTQQFGQIRGTNY